MALPNSLEQTTKTSLNSPVERGLCHECSKFNWAYHLTRHIDRLARDSPFWDEDSLATRVIKTHKETPRSRFLDTSNGWCWIEGAPYAGSYQIYEDKSATKVKLGPYYLSGLSLRKCSLCHLISDAFQAAYIDEGASEHENLTRLRQLCLGGAVIQKLELHFKNLDRNTNYDPPILTVTMDVKFNDAQHQVQFGFALADFRTGLSFHSMLNDHQIDFDQVRYWLKTCTSEHPDRCKPEKHHDILNFKVIDVHTARVVLAPAGCTYFALSYMWGTSKPARVKIQIFQRSRVKFRRGQSMLNLTVQNSHAQSEMRCFFVEAIGERYLWVDSLCITQGEEEEIKAMIDAMHMVYKSAGLTVIAASSRDVDNGITGLYPGSRSIEYATGYVDGIQLVSTEKNLQLELSPWARRGWTYQEY